MKSENKDLCEIVPGYSTIKDFTQDGFKLLIEATKYSNALPQERNWDFYQTHESFRNIMSNEGDEILHLINNLVKEQGVSGSFSSRGLDEKGELIVEANDCILERVANNLDEINGIKKNPEIPVKIQAVSAVLPVNGSWNKIDNINCTVSTFESSNKKSIASLPNSIRLLTGTNIQSPQKFFKDRIDNSNKYPWEPRITEKPNSLKPLAIYLEQLDDGTEVFCHPYEFELERFEPSPDLLTVVKPVKPKPISNTPLKMIETAEELDSLLEDLRKYKELAVDLEHHSYRTFLGITCLMQISTADTDYIIDTLCLRDKLYKLNEVFTKPTIVKIFHGSDHDVEWLQRDLSLYIVNMFDTFQAAKQLGYEQRSLAFLLKKFCQVDANKHFQLADWRIRPLPEELKLYARDDTHYLTYIYHMMRNELIELGNKKPHILKSVIQRSTEICKTRYVKPILKDESHMDLYRRCKKLFDNRQMFAMKELYRWRDSVAREKDESIGYVLPNHMLLQIAEILPREMQGVLACCNPIPQLVKANLLEIHKIVLRARDQSLVKPILSEEVRSRGSTQMVSRINIDNALNCPHDLTYTKEFRDDLPTLLGNILKQKKSEKMYEQVTTPTSTHVAKIETIKPRINIFDKIENCLLKLNFEVSRKVQKLKFLGPFERYKLVKPYIQAEEEKRELLEKEENPVSIDNQDSSEIKETRKNVNKDTFNDADRIARLHQHFIKEAASVPQILPSNQDMQNKEILSLKQMGGRKRKRRNEDDYGHIEYEERIPSDVRETSMLDTAVYSNVRPDLKPMNVLTRQQKKNRKAKNKKQKLKNQQMQGTSSNNTEDISQQVNKKNKGQKKNKQSWGNESKSKQTKRSQKFMRQQQWQQNQQINPQPTNLDVQDIGQSSQNKQTNSRKRKWDDRDRNNFQAFDYSSVDFRQFQGGGGNVNSDRPTRGSFRGKKNNRGKGIGKGQNKSAVFDMGNKNTGRGRGRHR